MIFYPFIEKTGKYLKSVRILKNYVTFDMIFPHTWILPKKLPENIEIVQTESPEGQITTSLVCPNNKDNVTTLENILETIIKTNLEKEEKERLFQNKVEELKTIFEKQDLKSLKGLNFDLEEFSSIINNEKDFEKEPK